MAEIAKQDTENRAALLETLPAVNRALLDLRAGAQTGKFTDITMDFRQFVHQAFGTVDPEIQQLEDILAISNYLAPKMRPKGSGSTSDMEFQAYRNALLSLEKTPLSNYIALYAFKKTIENGATLNDLERQLLADETINDLSVVTEQLNAVDKGIFVQLPEEIKTLRNQAGREDEYLKRASNFFNSLEDGEVFDNSDEVFKGGPFLVKGWEKLGWGK